jgi:hypothetical protein
MHIVHTALNPPRTNPINWVGGRVPTYGQAVSFPEIMSTFGSDSCDPSDDGSTIDADCKIGTVVSVDLSSNLAVQVVAVAVCDAY